MEYLKLILYSNKTMQEKFLDYINKWFGQHNLSNLRLQHEKPGIIPWTVLLGYYHALSAKFPGNAQKSLSDIIRELNPNPVFHNDSVYQVYEKPYSKLRGNSVLAAINEKREKMGQCDGIGFTHVISKKDPPVWYIEFPDIPNHGTVFAKTNTPTEVTLNHNMLLHLPQDTEQEPLQTFSIQLIKENNVKPYFDYLIRQVHSIQI